MREVEIKVRCDVCREETIRARWLDRHGSQVSNRYDYAEGYLVLVREEPAS